jgi:hypothetical protein
VSDGPKAGTYDVSTDQEGGCSTAAEGYFAALYDAFGEAGLTYVAVSLQPAAQGLSYGFDTGSDDQLTFTGMSGVTVEVDDRGSTATITASSESNHGVYTVEGTSVETGRADLTVECASVLRPGS